MAVAVGPWRRREGTGSQGQSQPPSVCDSGQDHRRSPGTLTVASNRKQESGDTGDADGAAWVLPSPSVPGCQSQLPAASGLRASVPFLDNAVLT